MLVGGGGDGGRVHGGTAGEVTKFTIDSANAQTLLVYPHNDKSVHAIVTDNDGKTRQFVAHGGIHGDLL